MIGPITRSGGSGDGRGWGEGDCRPEGGQLSIVGRKIKHGTPWTDCSRREYQAPTAISDVSEIVLSMRWFSSNAPSATESLKKVYFV